MINYSIAIPNSRSGAYKVVTILILAMNSLVFGWLAGNGSLHTYTPITVVGFSVNIIFLLWLLISRLYKQEPPFNPAIIFLLSAACWAVSQKFLLAFLMLVFGSIGLVSNRNLYILFVDEGIKYPSFPIKHFQWNQVSQVILKDDILSIDLKDNRLLQFKLEPKVSAGIEVEAFNAWCRNKVGSGM